MSVCCRVLVVSLVALTHGACATAMQIESTPSGAEVTYLGKPVGTTPMKLDVDAGGMGSSVELTLKKGALQKTVTVPRSDIDMLGLGIGAGADTAACLALTGGGFVFGGLAAVIFPPCALAACVGPIAYLELPVQLFLVGFRAPDKLSVTLEPATGPPALGVPPDGTTPPTNYGY